jgi:hypothetical protein
LGAATAILLLVVPITTTYDGDLISCGPVVWKFLPVDPGGGTERQFAEFIACQSAGFENFFGVVGLTIATCVAGACRAKV